jgi:hypothetical protein
MANDKLKHFNRTDAIDLETAKKVFHDYYSGRTGSKIGRIRAKIFDMMYQKKPRFTLRPGEPGSARYLLEEGPRTFDMEGVDFFPEGTTVTVDDPDYRDNPPKVTSHGATYKHDGDNIDPDTINVDEQGNETSSQIYGPRLKTDELYNTHFKEHYNTRKTEGDLKNKFQDKHLVEIYWDKYKQNPKYYARKNKKKTKKQKKVEQKPVRQEEVVPEAQEEIQTHFFEFNNIEYSISAALDIYDSAGNIVGNINKPGEIQEEIVEYLLDKKFIQRFGENTYILVINNDKPYKFKNKTDDTIVIVNFADNTIFDENGEKLDISLDEYLEAYGISFSDLEMIAEEVEEEAEETKFYLHPETNEVIAIKGTNVYAIDDDGYPLKEPIESYRDFKEKYGVELSDLEEVDLEALREDDTPIVREEVEHKEKEDLESENPEPNPVDDSESIESIDFLNSLLEKGELDEDLEEEDEEVEDEEYYDEEELPELEENSSRKQHGGYSEEPLVDEEKRYILDSLANYIKSKLMSSQFFRSNIKDMTIDVL